MNHWFTLPIRLCDIFPLKDALYNSTSHASATVSNPATQMKFLPEYDSYFKKKKKTERGHIYGAELASRSPTGHAARGQQNVMGVIGTNILNP